MRLRDLLREIGEHDADGPLDVEVADVRHDSRAVERGDLFAAMRGGRTDGSRFAAEALRRGAVAVLSAGPRPEGVDGGTWVRVPDDRVAMARAAAAVHAHPSREISVVGITGTNGKTTTAFLLEGVLAAAGRRPGLLGTVAYRWSGHREEATRTTPEATDLQRMLRRMVEAGCGSAVLEVSSHALSLRRVEATAFRVAVFTNLSRDHLDYHRDLEDYFDAKALLFEMLGPEATAVINADDPRGLALRDRTRARVLTYGTGDGCDVRPRAWTSTFDGTRALLTTPAGEMNVQTPLPGLPNLQNVMAAVTAGIALGCGTEALVEGIRGTATVPGRFERIRNDRGFEVIVDYAHSDDALRNLLATVRSLSPRRVIAVFGCGGDRDREKRALMGRAAGIGSDVAILTSDNPRGEDPAAIAAAAEAGLKAARAEVEYEVELDRREAIRRALSLARPGDAVVIAGKGHERDQIIGDRVLPFDDREVCREFLETGG
ncbi:MAG: UDP-N-acetylmuramoyl-L-alanyl-D-glutamate--2,6-diaminopimelate ligase [Acidobacteriota bacterium]